MTRTDTISDIVPSGGTTTLGVFLGELDIFGLSVPVLTSTTLQLQVSRSTDQDDWQNLYDQSGTQILNWGASTGDRAFGSGELVHIIGYIRARISLGTAQAAARTFTWIKKQDS